jgi:hypothetical protein
MKLSELQVIIEERLEKHGDGEVEICLEMKVYGQRTQLSSDIGEVVTGSRNKIPYFMLLNSGFDE